MARCGERLLGLLRRGCLLERCGVGEEALRLLDQLVFDARIAGRAGEEQQPLGELAQPSRIHARNLGRRAARASPAPRRRRCRPGGCLPRIMATGAKLSPFCRVDTEAGVEL